MVDRSWRKSWDGIGSSPRVAGPTWPRGSGSQHHVPIARTAHAGSCVDEARGSLCMPRRRGCGTTSAKPSSAFRRDGMPGKVPDGPSRGSFPKDRDNRCTENLQNQSGGGPRFVSDRPCRSGNGNNRLLRPPCSGLDGAAPEPPRNRAVVMCESDGNPYMRLVRGYAPKFANPSWDRKHWSRDRLRRPRNFERRSWMETQVSTRAPGPPFRYACCRDRGTFHMIDRPEVLGELHASNAIRNLGDSAGRRRRPSRTRHLLESAVRRAATAALQAERPGLVEANRGPSPNRSAVRHGT